MDPAMYMVVTSSHIYLHCRAEIGVHVSIDRSNHNIKPTRRPPTYDPSSAVPLFGILGTINLVNGPCLIGIDGVRAVGALKGTHAVFQITSTRLQPFSATTAHLTPDEATSQAHCLDLLASITSDGDFYFSHTYDLSSSVQQQALMWQTAGGSGSRIALDEMADPRFYWNRSLHKSLIAKPELRVLAVPVIMGFVHIEAVNINGKPCQYCLISRRATARAGTRFFKRGIDEQGHVANYVETEQIVSCGSLVSSHVQVRGSFPLFWSQTPSFKYTPTIAISRTRDHFHAAKRHFNDLSLRFGEVLALNLAGHKKGEWQLCERYEAIANQLKSDVNLRYLHFDFHKECSRMRWHRLSLLMTSPGLTYCRRQCSNQFSSNRRQRAQKSSDVFCIHFPHPPRFHFCNDSELS
ncbi:hypothetical protein PTSG_06567 [Salpingoeca rosetta]|uniref:SAC domain-containing protein n=1 Tax=Salpingoeca rosetta (strain ATCC 50818 / BSB-021) TaxID=946362 RepID=F2UG64_SALR5|nr:uncharacterized protein PTSG_06567 [Salpingoeca rosetta]EGD75492.1 hypothetical protein PTSG_06567 [Salpingoeca rosetta]|eukprot:XP_004991949.1 hypothetical protein PTSG_06567 [Salpingoeca rosetta]